MIITRNQHAFLDTLGYSEGTTTSRITVADGYDVIVTGIDGKPEIFSTFYDHPFANGRAPKVINSAGLQSTASGRYQILYKSIWVPYKKMLNLPDFSAMSQDAVALQLIRECRAIPLIEAGRFEEAIIACKSRWASLPGANYPGQRMNKMEDLRKVYLRSGGTIS